MQTLALRDLLRDLASELRLADTPARRATLLEIASRIRTVASAGSPTALTVLCADFAGELIGALSTPERFVWSEGARLSFASRADFLPRGAA